MFYRKRFYQRRYVKKEKEACIHTKTSCSDEKYRMLELMDTHSTSSAKNAGFRIRVDDALRAKFIDACRARDITAAQVLREFMRTYIQNTKQISSSAQDFAHDSAKVETSQKQTGNEESR